MNEQIEQNYITIRLIPYKQTRIYYLNSNIKNMYKQK